MYFTHPIDFFALPILEEREKTNKQTKAKTKTKTKTEPKKKKKKKRRIYLVWFVFGMIPGVDSFLHHFGTVNK